MSSAGKRARKGSGRTASAPRPDEDMAVRMLVGPFAGRIVRVSKAEAVRLCGGWQPEAEPVAVKPSDVRETRSK